MTIIGAVIISGAGIFSSIYGANQQSKALQQASQTIQQGQQQSLGAIDKYLSPFVDFSKGLQPTLQSLLTPGPSQNVTLQQLPGFQFAKSIIGDEISAGAGRSGISGTTAVQGGELGGALASGYFSNFVNPLVQLYGTGPSAAGTAAQSAATVSTGAAQSLAGLQVGQGNVQAGLGGNIAGSISNALLLSKLTGGGGLNAGLHADQGGFYFGQ